MPAELMATGPRRVFMTTDAVGGVWQYTLDLLQGLVDRGVQVVLAILGPAPSADQWNAANEAGALHIHVTGLPLDWTAESEPGLEAACHALANLAAASGADIVHLHTPAFVSAGAWRAPVVAVAHSCVGTWWRAVHTGPLPADLAWRREAIAAGLQRADAILAPSHSFASALHNVYGTGFAVSVVHNGRAAHDLPERPPRESFVLSAGRIWDEGKNFRLLDECAARLDMPVVAAGPGTGPNGMSASLPHLRFLGILDRWRLQTLYARAAAFVSPAKYEPFGLAVLEAALEETPLILSDIPTFRELWADAAIFCAPDDVDAFVAAIRRLAASSDERSRLGCAARGRALRYTPTAMINGVLEVYRSLPRQAASRAA